MIFRFVSPPQILWANQKNIPSKNPKGWCSYVGLHVYLSGVTSWENIKFKFQHQESIAFLVAPPYVVVSTDALTYDLFLFFFNAGVHSSNSVSSYLYDVNKALFLVSHCGPAIGKHYEITSAEHRHSAHHLTQSSACSAAPHLSLAPECYIKWSAHASFLPDNQCSLCALAARPIRLPVCSTLCLKSLSQLLLSCLPSVSLCVCLTLTCLPATNRRPELCSIRSAFNNTCLPKFSCGSNYLLSVDLNHGCVTEQPLIVSVLYP